jgi:DNA repair ATPase RecN
MSNNARRKTTTTRTKWLLKPLEHYERMNHLQRKLAGAAVKHGVVSHREELIQSLTPRKG